MGSADDDDEIDDDKMDAVIRETPLYRPWR